MMKTTRVTAILALITQWAGQSLAFHMRSVLAKAIAEMSMSFPPHMRLIISLTMPEVWFALGAISSVALIASEVLVEAERVRLVLQIALTALWALLSLGAIAGMLSVVNAVL